MSKRNAKPTLARTLAPEEIRTGQYVAVFSEIGEYPSCFWCADAAILPPSKPVRITWLPLEDGKPLKVKAVCLPFVFVRSPAGALRTLDVRRYRLARLSTAYGKRVYKTLKAEAQSAKPLDT